ncbi:MAG: hypothetical protein F6K39_20910 [Okeania sp. SIO3B3]|nr:hypothetical protein [Okeania sp. SIO3B3]
MRYKFHSFLSFFLLSISGLLWVNYYPLVSQVNAQIITQKPPSSQDILDRLQKVIFNAKDEQPEPPYNDGDPKREGGSRTDEICIITPWFYKSENSPDKFVAEVFSEQPIFIWQGDIAEIFIQVPSENQQEIWAENVKRKNQIIYQGQSLERGKIYEVFFHKGSTTSLPFPFKIIDGDRRATIESELKALSEKYPGISAEEMALLRANYFMEKGLFGDAYQELFSVAKPSAELKENLEGIKKAEFCPDE